MTRCRELAMQLPATYSAIKCFTFYQILAILGHFFWNSVSQIFDKGNEGTI